MADELDINLEELILSLEAQPPEPDPVMLFDVEINVDDMLFKLDQLMNE